MANYSTLFCVELADVTDEEFDWLIKSAAYKPAEGAEEEAEDPPWYHCELLAVPFDTNVDREGRLFYVESDGDSAVDQACEFLKAFLAKFRPLQYAYLEWACTCDRNRPDGFGGGAAFITATEIKYDGSSNWLARQIKKFERKPPKRPVYVYRFELVSAEPIPTDALHELAADYDPITPGVTRVSHVEGVRVRRAETYYVEAWFEDKAQ